MKRLEKVEHKSTQLLNSQGANTQFCGVSLAPPTKPILENVSQGNHIDAIDENLLLTNSQVPAGFDSKLSLKLWSREKQPMTPKLGKRPYLEYESSEGSTCLASSIKPIRKIARLD